MPLGQRVIVIGGGHNGLIAAFYLAKGGFKPVVLERREMVGGGAVTEEFHPGSRASTLAHSLGPLRADIAADLQVEKFDCEILRPDPRVFAPTPDGRAILFYDDVRKTAGGIARISAKDGEQYVEFAEDRARRAEAGEEADFRFAALGPDGCGGFRRGVFRDGIDSRGDCGPW